MGVIERYRDRLPVGAGDAAVDARRGGTPLDPRPGAIGERLGVELHFKFEGMNPTGSFKDRGMAVAVAKAVEAGADGIICASTGNTAASAAAYGGARRAPHRRPLPGRRDRRREARAVARGRCEGARGARELRRGAAQLPRRSSRRARTSLVNSLNPHRIEGQKTAAFEIDEAARPGAGRARAALRRRRQHGRVRQGLRRGRGRAPDDLAAHAVERATTLASAIRIAEPAHVARGRRARRRRARRAGRRRRRGHHANVARARQPRGHLLRAVVGRRPRGARADRRSSPAAPSSAS